MRAVIQRISCASFIVAAGTTRTIEAGIQYCKAVHPGRHWFSDESFTSEIGGDTLAISQSAFWETLEKENGSLFNWTELPDTETSLYEHFFGTLSEAMRKRMSVGCFGRHIEVTPHNDDLKILVMDTKQKDF